MISRHRSRNVGISNWIAGVAFWAAMLLAGLAAPLHARNGPETDGNEIAIWTSGGHGTNGSTHHTSMFSVGFRYGWVITAPRGPGFLRGRFEYAVDAVPLLLVFRPVNTVYGAAINPVGLIWNFDRPGRIVPYVELGGGDLFTSSQVPPGTSRINFMTHGALGLRFLTEKAAWDADLRFVHTSNSGISAVNPGINTLELRVGLSWFSHH
jgi:hypothetical protein